MAPDPNVPVVESDPELAAAIAAVAGEAGAGLAWLVADPGRVRAGSAGTWGPDEPRPIAADTIFRISSMTKPITAVAALTLVDDGTIGLDDPVERWLPELADPQVLVDPDGPVDRTAASPRSITVRDLLEFRSGHGLDFERYERQSTVAALAEAGLPPGPPRPQEAPGPDELVRTVASVPLERPPGERWRYHVPMQLLGVLLERAAGTPLDRLLARRVLEPLGMVDTAFWVEGAAADRLGPCFGRSAEGDLDVFDPAHGQWTRRPALLDGGAGLVSTVADCHAFARMLLAGGVAADGRRIVAEALVGAMTTDHLAADDPGPSPEEGWGWGLGVQRRATAHRPVGSYGWGGGLGSTWSTDPATGRTVVLLTNQLLDGPHGSALVDGVLDLAVAA